MMNNDNERNDVSNEVIIMWNGMIRKWQMNNERKMIIM